MLKRNNIDMINFQNASKYCFEDISLIENYELAIADQSQTWDCHHRAEILPCGRFSQNDLKKAKLFYKVPASHLIFLTHEEHLRLHMQDNVYMLGRHLSNEHRAKIAVAMKGKPSSRKGKHLSDETKQKLSKARAGKKLSAEHRAKISLAKKGKNHPNFGKQFSSETKAKISEARIKFWQRWREEHGK